MRPRETYIKNDTVIPSDKHPGGNMNDRCLLVDRQHGQWKWKRVDIGIHIDWIISSSWEDVQDKKKKKKRNASRLNQNLSCLLLVCYPVYCQCTCSMIGFWGGLKINKTICANTWNVHGSFFVSLQHTAFPLL